MGNLEKFERATKENNEAVKDFERAAKKQHLDLRREGDAPTGYWYTNNDTNIAFKWFLSGFSYGKLIERV